MTLRTTSTETAVQGNTRTRQLAARRLQIVAVAEQLFLKHGFAKTSVNAIVREAGGSLATLYAEFGTKEALFESVLSGRAATFFPEERSAPRKPVDATTQLRRLAAHMLRRMLSDDGLAIYRIAVHEAPRFAALRKAMLEVGMPGLLDRTACYLERLDGSDALQIDDARMAAGQFIALVQGQLVFRAACGEQVSARTRTKHVNSTVKAFLKLYRPMRS